MNPEVKINLVAVLEALIDAHQKMQPGSDFHTRDLVSLVDGLKNGQFFAQSTEGQLTYLGGINEKYLGKGEVLWALIPKYLDEEFEGKFRAAFSEAIKEVKSEI